MASGACKGEGICLLQTDEGYRRWKPCQHNCQLVKCPNFALCSTLYPLWLLRAHQGMCYSCNITFGRNLLPATSKDTCPLCLHSLSEWKLPSCEHEMCTQCVHSIYFGSWKLKSPDKFEEYDPDYIEPIDAQEPTSSDSDSDGDTPYSVNPVNEEQHQPSCPVCQASPKQPWKKPWKNQEDMSRFPLFTGNHIVIEKAGQF